MLTHKHTPARAHARTHTYAYSLSPWPTGSMLRQWFMRSVMRPSKPGAKKVGSIATKHWLRSAGRSVLVQSRMLGPYGAPGWRGRKWREEVKILRSFSRNVWIWHVGCAKYDIDNIIMLTLVLVVVLSIFESHLPQLNKFQWTSQTLQ